MQSREIRCTTRYLAFEAKAAKVLGYEVVILDADDEHDRHGHRCINGVPGLKVPAAVIRKQCALRRGKPIST